MDRTLKSIVVEDFSGGRTNFLDQSIIPNNMCTSASMNVWNPERGLTKAPGFSTVNSVTASGSASVNMLWQDDGVTPTYNIFYRGSLSATGGIPGYEYLYASNGLTDSLTPIGYSAGTMSMSGSKLISATGNGTSWLTNVTANDMVFINSLTGGRYLVSSVEDNTHLTLISSAGSAVPTGTAYTITPGILFQEIAQASLNGNFCNVATGHLLQSYSSTGFNRISSAPSSAYLASFKNYMFAARTNTAESRLYWSAVKNPTSWPANNFSDVFPQSNGKITGMVAFGNELIIFKSRGMYKVLGDVFDPANPTYQIVQIMTPSDFIFNSNYSSAIYGDYTYSTNALGSIQKGALVFYANGRVYRYLQGTSYISDISPNILRDLPPVGGSGSDSMASVAQRIFGIVNNGYYILYGFPSDPNNASTGDTYQALLLDRQGAWWYLSNRNALTSNNGFGTTRGAVISTDTTKRPQLIILSTPFTRFYTCDFIGPSFGTNYQTDDGSGNGSSVAINAQWVSKEFNIDFGTFKWVVVYLKKQSAGNLTVQWSIDQGSQVTNNVDMTTGRGQIIRAVLPVNQTGSTIQITLSNNTFNQTFKVYAVKIYYEESLEKRLL